MTDLQLSQQEIRFVLGLVKAADKHCSQNIQESIIVDADNLSKLNIDHVSEKYQKTDWCKMYDLWIQEFPNRIQTKLGKRIYPQLLKQLKKDIKKSNIK